MITYCLTFRFDILLWPKHGSVKDQLSPVSHSEYIKTVLKTLNIDTSKVVHLFRASGAFEASLHGCSFEAIVRSGRWHMSQNQALAMAYLGSICTDVGLLLAGFPSTASSEYLLERDALMPPYELMAKVFPFLQEMERRVLEVEFFFNSWINRVALLFANQCLK